MTTERLPAATVDRVLAVLSRLKTPDARHIRTDRTEVTMAVSAGPSVIRWTEEENARAVELAKAGDFPTLVDRFRNLLADLREAREAAAGQASMDA